MLGAIWRSAVLSAFIALIIFTLLRIGEWLVPHLFTAPIDWWVLGLLFAVGFVPRLIYILLGPLIRPLVPPRRRRKT
jgi:hypothetical protein